MEFTKMHGAGNDYVYVNGFEQRVDDPNKVASFVSDRHFGIGSDGLVLILPSEQADFRMRMFNADGSEAEMCGNAIRCVAKYVFDRKMTKKTSLIIETKAGNKPLTLNVKDGLVYSVRVNMGRPILHPADIPVSLKGDRVINRTIELDDCTFAITCVSMGNPHAIAYVKDVDAFDLEKYGPLMENHPLFPHRINAEFVQVIDRNTLKMRVWERGAKETLACGTGAAAVLTASVLNGYSERKAKVIVRGGELWIEWDETADTVFMTGPATEVFTGSIDLSKMT